MSCQNYRLISLWEMLQLPLGALMASFQRLAGLCQYLAIARGESKLPAFSARDWQEQLDRADEFERLCGEVGMFVTQNAAKRVCQDLRLAERDGDYCAFKDHGLMARAHNALDQLIGCVRHEAPTKVALMLPADKVALYEPASPVGGAEVRSKFPSAIYDLDEASKCLALGRPTASVFHAMRVVEVSLKAVSKCLGLPVPSSKNWGTWLGPIRDECQRRNKPKKWAEYDLFQDVWQRIDAIKDAQRNPTLHVETTHTEEEALLIFRNTESFMKKLASRMDERGAPFA